MELIENWRRRSRKEQWIDVLGLLHQGFAVPWCANLIGLLILPAVLPEAARVFFRMDLGLSAVPGWVLFLLPLTLVDYLYYWNHRLLHRARLWSFHRVHHSAKSLDIWMTSRNSFWTPFLLVYVWVHAFLIYAVPDPTPYVWGMFVHGALDLWRHSTVATPKSLLWLGAILILPEDHGWHHARDKFGINFGANLSLWDRLHGTLYRSAEPATAFGESGDVSLDPSFSNAYLRPWRLK